MTTLTNEQIEQKKQQFLRPCGSKRPKVERKQLAEQAEVIYKELAEAGAIELSEDDLDKAAGGYFIDSKYNPLNNTPTSDPEPDVDRPAPGSYHNPKKHLSF